MTILFLPIDIDLPNLTFTPEPNAGRTTEFNPFWTSTFITADVAYKHNLDKILNLLPFDNITTLTHKIQDRAVSQHIDVYPEMTFKTGEYNHICVSEPAGYRILLKGHLDRLEVFNGKEWITAQIPAAPGCYILNSTKALHRVKSDPGREIIYVRGFLNLEKHRALLDQSYKKYKDYVIKLL